MAVEFRHPGAGDAVGPGAALHAQDREAAGQRFADREAEGLAGAGRHVVVGRVVESHQFFAVRGVWQHGHPPGVAGLSRDLGEDAPVAHENQAGLVVLRKTRVALQQHVQPLLRTDPADEDRHGRAVFDLRHGRRTVRQRPKPLEVHTQRDFVHAPDPERTQFTDHTGRRAHGRVEAVVDGTDHPSSGHPQDHPERAEQGAVHKGFRVGPHQVRMVEPDHGNPPARQGFPYQNRRGDEAPHLDHRGIHLIEDLLKTSPVDQQAVRGGKDDLGAANPVQRAAVPFLDA